MAIPKIYKYGIEITKPWSKEMYAFNESIANLMINEIKAAIRNLQDREEAQELAQIINPYRYIDYDLEDMQFDMMKNTETIENYWLSEIWDDLITHNFVEPIFGENDEVYNIIGFESREEILKLREKYSTETI